jgi:hypothetical protein
MKVQIGRYKWVPENTNEYFYVDTNGNITIYKECDDYPISKCNKENFIHCFLTWKEAVSESERIQWINSYPKTGKYVIYDIHGYSPWLGKIDKYGYTYNFQSPLRYIIPFDSEEEALKMKNNYCDDSKTVVIPLSEAIQIE